MPSRHETELRAEAGRFLADLEASREVFVGREEDCAAQIEARGRFLEATAEDQKKVVGLVVRLLNSPSDSDVNALVDDFVKGKGEEDTKKQLGLLADYAYSIGYEGEDLAGLRGFESNLAFAFVVTDLVELGTEPRNIQGALAGAANEAEVKSKKVGLVAKGLEAVGIKDGELLGADLKTVAEVYVKAFDELEINQSVEFGKELVLKEKINKLGRMLGGIVSEDEDERESAEQFFIDNGFDERGLNQLRTMGIRPTGRKSVAELREYQNKLKDFARLLKGEVVAEDFSLDKDLLLFLEDGMHIPLRSVYGLSMRRLEEMVVAQREVREIETSVVGSPAREETEEQKFEREYGCSRVLYDQIAKFAMDCVFLGGAQGAIGVLNKLVREDATSPWIIFNGGRINQPLPAQLKAKIEAFGFEGWAAVKSVMSSWEMLKDTEDLSASHLKRGLFFERTQELALSSIKDVMFPSLGSDRTYNKTKLLSSAETEIGEAMKVLVEYFSNPRNIKTDGSGKFVKDYWSFVSKSQTERSAFYESLGLSRYMGEAAFAFLLSNLMLTEKGVGLDPFCVMVLPAKKREANFAVDPERDLMYAMLLQQEYAKLGVDATVVSPDMDRKKKLARENTTRVLRTLIPNKLVPTGNDDGGAEALDSGKWLSWRVQNYSATGEREGVPVVQNDVDTRLTILRQALVLGEAVKKAVAPSKEGTIDLLKKVKSAAFVHEVAYLAGANWSLDGKVHPEFDFVDDSGRPLGSSASEWVSRFNLGVIEIALATRAVSNRYNQSPLKMTELAKLIDDIFAFDHLTGKNVFIGLESPSAITGVQLNDDHRRELAMFTNDLWFNCGSLIRRVNYQAADYFKKLPGWYGKQAVSAGQLEVLKTWAGLGAWDKIIKDRNLGIRPRYW